MINLSIPGQMPEKELKAIERLAVRVPPNGVVVEIGSLFGRSSYTWATSVPASANVYCIDPWVREQWMIDFVETMIPDCPPLSFEAFQHYVGDLPNIIPIRAYSPQGVSDWSRPVDIVFDDSNHTNPWFRNNLNFWSQHLRPGGILCGHDYCDDWPDVRSEVDGLAREWKTKVSVVGMLWWLEAPKRRSWT
jgi:hypothetical protein